MGRVLSAQRLGLAGFRLKAGMTEEDGPLQKNAANHHSKLHIQTKTRSPITLGDLLA
ncbi:hypothetical protein AGR4C_Cc80467 [Agrobacterium tumefaciens str. Kerr 14]|uniref:Uncharacterized protein n=1 Tax=Agrobacterium tumefaciens str. Kerr 14 TaxID=1183424 RepID=A0A1S7QS60_AGRTU|nr:hypothetical protein AGR4C_Cc80467 [Agrobacterium tumefaciens str. Kerr 14]